MPPSSTSPADPTAPVAIVLAAGRGTRMGTDLPKVLCEAAGKPLVSWVLEALEAAGIRERIVVVGHRAADVERALADVPGVSFALQTALRGTGDAVAAAVPALERAGGGAGRPVVVVCGDSPMLRPESIAGLLREFSRRRAACLLGTAVAADPTGLGRIVRDAAGRFLRIVEQRDAGPAELAIREVNMSTYVFAAGPLVAALGRLDNGNAAGEYYLTDCPRLLAESGLLVDADACLDASESLSVNTPDQLAAVAAALAGRGAVARPDATSATCGGERQGR